MICNKNECTGCYACYNICPKNAIEMKKDEYGNVYPIINTEKCINCGLCKKICPQLNKKIKFHIPISTYAMYLSDKQKRKESTSGGAATAFYENVLKDGGVVYGASNLFGGEKFKFIRVNDINQLYKIKGSKYVHCYIEDNFRLIKKDLEDGIKVLFIGTPCQVAGLKSYLIKDFDNLITADIICHGVPSQQLLFDEINNTGINKDDVAYVVFRDEKRFNFTLLDKNKRVLYSKISNLVPYYRNFLKGHIYRENCYSCMYAKKERVSDITIGDFWGLSKESKIYDDENKGISVVVANTNKGLNMINSIENECIIEKRSFEEARLYNGQLNHPMKKSKFYDIYIKKYPIDGYNKTMNKMLTIKDKIKIGLQKNKFVYKLIKKIKLK